MIAALLGGIVIVLGPGAGGPDLWNPQHCHGARIVVEIGRTPFDSRAFTERKSCAVVHRRRGL